MMKINRGCVEGKKGCVVSTTLKTGEVYKGKNGCVSPIGRFGF